MIRRVLSLTLPLFLFALLGACAPSAGGTASERSAREPTQAQIGKSFGTANGMPMGFDEFDEVAARRGAIAKGMSDEERKTIVDGLVDEKLLYLKALEEGVDLGPKIQRMVVNTFLKDQVYAEVRETNPTEDDLVAYYEAHKEDFVVPEKRQVKRILFKTREGEDKGALKARADEVRGELEGAGINDWDGLAVKHSDGPYSARGGDLGYLGDGPRPGVDPAVIAKAFEASGTGVTDVFETAEGYNIVNVVAVRPRVERTFRQIKGAVARKAKAERYKKVYEDYVASLRKDAQLDINWDAVDAHEVKGGRRLKPPKPSPRSPGPAGSEGSAPSLPAKPERHSDHRGDSK